MARLPQEIIRAKRDGAALEAQEITAFIAGLTRGEVSEGQAAAFAMAVFFRGMSPEECVALTLAMRDSGRVMRWGDLPGPVLDKHSTGGIGDTVSLMLAPAVAACGGFVPMISGRGLGHTGGTLDKLHSIPGYVTTPEADLLARVVRAAGCAIIGQTADLAPADGRLYAIRDVTATVESLPLITASILSKKLAAGLGGLVMDVKTGSGAFMQTLDEARALARSLVTVATGAGLPTTALITDMDTPLSDTAGNALEVRYALDYLTGRRREPRMHALVVALGAEMLVLGGLAPDLARAAARLEEAIATGRAAERFGRMVAALGGPADLLETPDRHLAGARLAIPLCPPRAGVVQRYDMRAVGMAIVALGGGRTRTDQRIDASVGLSSLAPVGAAVGPHAPLAVIHANDEARANEARARLLAACVIGDHSPPSGSLILERLAA